MFAVSKYLIIHIKLLAMNTKTIISKDKAQQLCNEWHGGQWSALYQFGSSKVWDIANTLRYVWEIQQDLQQEFFAAYPQILSKKTVRELTQLRDFFMFKAVENNVPVVLVKHDLYGYEYPLLSPNGTTEEMIQVKQYSIPV